MLMQNPGPRHVGRVGNEATSEYYKVYNDSVAHLVAAGAGGATSFPIPVEKRRECIVHFINENNTTGGTVVSLMAQLQLMNPMSNTGTHWDNYGAPIAVTSGGFTTALAYNSLLTQAVAIPVGAQLRWLLTVSASTSDGQISVIMELKG